VNPTSGDADLLIVVVGDQLVFVGRLPALRMIASAAVRRFG
jgi:hypothetical protein